MIHTSTIKEAVITVDRKSGALPSGNGGSLKKFIALLLAGFIAIVSACQLSGTTPSAGTPYTVTYNGNGNTGGSAPKDSITYQTGATVTVSGNTGSLVKAGYPSFAWNTTIDGSGTYYAPTATFAMGTADVTMYAMWMTAPTVSSTNPADVAIGVGINDMITATFSAAMDPATITSVSFALAHGGTPVAGTVVYDEASKTAVFAPTSVLAAGLLYTATVTTGVKNIAGDAMAANKVWTFTTASAGAGPAPVRLGTAGNYVILAKAAITDVPASAITGNIGLSPPGCPERRRKSKEYLLAALRTGDAGDNLPLRRNHIESDRHHAADERDDERKGPCTDPGCAPKEQSDKPLERGRENGSQRPGTVTPAEGGREREGKKRQGEDGFRLRECQRKAGRYGRLSDTRRGVKVGRMRDLPVAGVRQ
jgi:hypothetical protein